MHTGKDRKREKINRWKSHVWSWRCEGKKTRCCLKAAFWTVVLKAINTLLFCSGKLYCLVLYIFFSIVFSSYCTVICISYLCFNTYMKNFATVIDKCCTDRIRTAFLLGPARIPLLDSPLYVFGCLCVFLLYILKWNQQRMDLSSVQTFGLWGLSDSAVSFGCVPLWCTLCSLTR